MDVLFENMQVKIRNVHIRFEDNMVSRKDHSFNFCLMWKTKSAEISAEIEEKMPNSGSDKLNRHSI